MTLQPTCLHTIRPWALILGLSLAEVPLAQSAESVNPPSSPTQAQVPGPSSTPTNATDICEGLSAEHCEYIKRLSPEHREKLERTLREGRERDKARRLQVVPSRETGIIEVNSGDSRFKFFQIENQWHGFVKGGGDTDVYAGGMDIDPATEVHFDPLTLHGSVIIVRNGTADKPTPFNEKRVSTPTAVGLLRIIEAKGSVLTLQSRQGYKFSLNVETEQLTSLGPK